MQMEMHLASSHEKKALIIIHLLHYSIKALRLYMTQDFNGFTNTELLFIRFWHVTAVGKARVYWAEKKSLLISSIQSEEELLQEAIHSNW